MQFVVESPMTKHQFEQKSVNKHQCRTVTKIINQLGQAQTAENVNLFEKRQSQEQHAYYQT